MGDVALKILWYVGFVVSTVLHEAAHALAAKKGGDLTAYQGGQVTLDPMPHIRREPFGMVVLPVFSILLSGWPIGFASAPYDPFWAERHPRRAALMSLAGPGANLLLVLLAALLIRAGVGAGVFRPPFSFAAHRITESASEGIWTGVAVAVSILFTLNLVLFVLNLIPFPPLDGSGAIALFLPLNAARRWRRFLMESHLGIVGLLLAWLVFDRVFAPFFGLALRLVY